MTTYNNSCPTNTGADVFNNPSNDYVDPGFAPCAGAADSKTFEFLSKKNVGIISGSDTLQSMSLSNISIPTTEWISKNQTIQSGEIIYVPGLSKGLMNKITHYPLPDFGYENQEFFFMVDFSINYFSNFRLTEKNIDASSNFDLNIDIDDALNLALSDEGTGVSAFYDPSTINFVGNNVGFDFDVENVVLTIIDASMDSNSPFPAIIIDGERYPQTYVLELDKDNTIPAMKYPNGAMLGYMLTTNYSPEFCIADSWLYTNNVSSPFDVYYEQMTPTGISNIETNQIITFIPPTDFGEVSIGFDNVNDASLADFPDFPTADISSIIALPNGDVNSRLLDNLSILDSSIYVALSVSSFYQGSEIISNYWDASTLDPSGLVVIEQTYNPSNITMGIIKDSSLITYNHAIDPSLLDPSMIGPIIQDPSVFDTIKTYINTSEIQESNIIGQYVALSDVSTLFGSVPEPSAYNYEITDSILKNTNILSSFIIDSSIQGRIVSDTGQTDIDNPTELYNSILIRGQISNIFATDTYFENTNISQSIIPLSFFKNVNIVTSEINTCHVYDSSIQFTEINDSIINNNDINDSVLFQTDVSNARMTQTTIVSSEVNYSELENLYINYAKVSPTLWVPDSSLSRAVIRNSNIYDASIFNTDLIDCSVFNSNIEDSSIFGCTSYNSFNLNVDSSDSKTYWVNSQIDCSTTWDQDSSLLYEKYTKTVDVGMNGNGDEKVLSAGEYLDYINSHNLWEKFGPLSAKFSTVDPLSSNIKNLIGGFYVFNPHEFPVQLEYMLIN